MNSRVVLTLLVAGGALSDCSSGPLCDARSCVTGCCDSLGACVQTPHALACGTQGQACQACAGGQACLLGACVGASGTGGGPVVARAVVVAEARRRRLHAAVRCSGAWGNASIGRQMRTTVAFAEIAVRLAKCAIAEVVACSRWTARQTRVLLVLAAAQPPINVNRVVRCQLIARREVPV